MTGWQRLGRLPLDTRAASWAVTHAALPVVEHISGPRFTLYLSLRDALGRAKIGRTTLNMDGVPSLAPLAAEPVLDIGALGAFDDSGVTSSSVVVAGEHRLLYYTGWSRGVTVPFYLAAGLAVSEGGGAFRRISVAPLLDRNAVDPFLTASPFVMREDGGWRMWYVSASEWRSGTNGAKHYYHIRYAESRDGYAWKRGGTVCIDYESPDEHAFARPWVVRDVDRYRMWYAWRGERYRIGYAESRDGTQWTRDDGKGLSAGTDAWESSMVAYPCVFEWDGRRYMLYNGNDYGRTGVGLAVLGGE